MNVEFGSLEMGGGNDSHGDNSFQALYVLFKWRKSTLLKFLDL